MKKQLIIFSILLLFFSCSKNEDLKAFPFDKLIFSSSGLRYKYSIKFTKSDTVYFKRIYPEPIENYFVILETAERETLNKLSAKFDFEKFKDEYVEGNLFDGTSYLINIFKEGKNKKILLYGNVYPQEVEKFITSLVEIKSKLKFLPTNKSVDFGDLEPIFPPPPPIPVKKVN